jgi:hypothetical protein
MSFDWQKRLVRVVVLGAAVAAVGAPASFAQDPYSGEGYGGSMDGGSPVSRVHALDPAIQGAVPTTPSWYATARRKTDEWVAHSGIRRAAEAATPQSSVVTATLAAPSWHRDVADVRFTGDPGDLSVSFDRGAVDGSAA